MERPVQPPVETVETRGHKLRLRRTERVLSWGPGRAGYSTANYDPAGRAPPPPTDGVDLHLRTLHTDGLPEHVEWAGNATAADGRSICAGMWIGNKIIYKTCVELPAV